MTEPTKTPPRPRRKPPASAKQTAEKASPTEGRIAKEPDEKEPIGDFLAAARRWIRAPGRAIAGVAVLALLLAVAPLLGLSTPLSDRLVRDYLLRNPEVIEEAVTKLQEKRELEARDTIRAAVRDNLEGLQSDPRDFAIGPPASRAKTTVVQFFDYRCPYCKAVAEEYLRLAQANPDVRFVFKEWPILDGGGPPISEYAARMAIAAQAQGKYLPVHQAMMAVEGGLTPQAVDEIMTRNGVDLAQAREYAGSLAVSEQIRDVRTLAEALQASGTPTFVIGPDVLEPYTGEESLRAAIAAAKRG